MGSRVSSTNGSGTNSGNWSCGTGASPSLATTWSPCGVAAIILRSASFSMYIVAFSPTSVLSQGPTTKGPGIAPLMSRGPTTSTLTIAMPSVRHWTPVCTT